MENIAIVGIANLFPGSSTPEQFWRQLLEKRDFRCRATEAKMNVDPDRYYGKKGDPDKYYCLNGGYIKDFNFDPMILLDRPGRQGEHGLTAEYLAQLDDIYQWALYVAYQSLQDAGYWGSDALNHCGVIFGNLSFPNKTSNHLFMPLYHQVVDDALKLLLGDGFQLSNFTSHTRDYVHPDNGLLAGYPSSLIAMAAGLGGSHFSLDAACASSCYSVKLACDLLHTGKADMMLAGAISAADPFFVNMGFSIFQAYPDNNFHAPFDKNTRGLFAGEGAGMVVLKRHSDAVRDGDKIYALVRGGGLSNDGRGEFVLSPNPKGQLLVYERAYLNAGIAPDDIDYIECHATGTPKGDKVELEVLESFFSRHIAANGRKPFLGSVKSNLGHLLTAAGMASITKTVFGLNENKIPATINVADPNISKNGFFNGEQIPSETIDWPRGSGDKPRMAGINVFGFGGSNAHLILQEAGRELQQRFDSPRPREPMAIIGMDAHFGRVKNLPEFKSLIEQNETTFRELPPLRWKGIETNPAVMGALGLPRAPRGGYIESFEIDLMQFKIPPNEEDCLIPQQLMMMRVADNAARDAGLKEGGNVAVLVAMGSELDLHQYRGRVNLATQIETSLRQQGVELSGDEQQHLCQLVKSAMAEPARLNQFTSYIGNIMASRISALWDFNAPSFTVSAEENSVYRCVELAETLFQTSDVEAVIIAGVDLSGSLENISLRQNYGSVSVNASIATGGDNILDNDQWLVGEGAAAFVLKPASAAARDSVYATIDGIGFASGIAASSILSAAEKALSTAGVEASDIVSVEAHASGFLHENMSEKQALSALYPEAELTSVKANVGHTFNASGAASIVKSALILNEAKNSSGGQKCKIAISGLGKDESCCHLILSSPDAVRGSMNADRGVVDKVSEKPQLVRTIDLGGQSISQGIAGHRESREVKIIRKKFEGKALRPVSNPVAIQHIRPKGIVVEIPNDLNNIDRIKKSGISKPVEINNEIMKSKILQKIDQQISAHYAFLNSRQVAQKKISELIALQAALSSPSLLDITGQTAETGPASSSGGREKPKKKCDVINPDFGGKTRPIYRYAPLPLKEDFSKPEKIIWNTDDLVEFAEGDITNVFGGEYGVIDTYPRRVRLPTTDYLLVSRVIELDAAVNTFKKSYICTEYDIPIDAPYLIDGQIPWCVAVESGQCDLLLISYMGIDFQMKGQRVYRLLDCELTFLEPMPFGGQTLRYEIYIDSFAKNGDQLLFFFHYDCFVGSRKVLMMRKGCAGFFTDEELAEGKGIVYTDKDLEEQRNAVKSTFVPLIRRNRDRYDYDDMMKLIRGDIVGCLGREYDQRGRNPSLKFSSEKFLMIERITRIEDTGGHWGLGIVEGQKDLEPDHWYFPCHFKDDQVMAGSLMSEGCGQMVMFYMLSLGMHSHFNNARFQPMPGEPQMVRCRGQVTPQSNTLTYRMEVTAIGMEPEPFLKANIRIFLGDKPVVDFKNLCMKIVEQDDDSPYRIQLPDNVETVSKQGVVKDADNRDSEAHPVVDERGIDPFKDRLHPLMRVVSDENAAPVNGVLPITHFEAPFVPGQNRKPDSLPFTPWHMFEFATGSISKCFGPEFSLYEEPGKHRYFPRIPCGDLQLITQVVDIEGRRHDFGGPSRCTAEYYVPVDAWYFGDNSHSAWMPYSVLSEIAMQPCGFLSFYLGTTLKYPDRDLYFRNLDGNGTLLANIDVRGKTIINRPVLKSTSFSGHAIIQNFSFDLSVRDQSGVEEPFYTGTAVFGYFSREWLSRPSAADDGESMKPWHIDHPLNPVDTLQFNLKNPGSPVHAAMSRGPFYRLPAGQLQVVDRVTISEGAGKTGIAYVYGEHAIDCSDWVFRYHFHKDPIMPGSLAMQAITELLQVYAIKNQLGSGLKSPRFVTSLSEVSWSYRGEISPLDKLLSVDLHITNVFNDAEGVVVAGDSFVYKDGKCIFEINNIAIAIVESQ